MEPKPCNCDQCLTSQRIKAEKPTMTPETLAIVRHLWNSWEDAATELEWLKSKLAEKNIKI